MISTIVEWMTSPVTVVDPDSAVSFALTLMRRRYVHSVVVNITEDKLTYGIVTTTDIRDKILAVDRNPSEVQVREIITAPVLTAKPGWSLKECSQKMQAHHMPVVDDGGELFGIISATDLFMAAEEIG